MSELPLPFPVPEKAARAQSQKLIQRIRDDISASGGRISLARYIELALFAPGLGYYSAGSRKFGAEGDFVTAPEISPLFSRTLSHQVAEVLSGLGGGEVLEAGAGSGTMAAEMLAELEVLGQLPLRYVILELSADLRQRQRETLQMRVPHLLERVVWLDSLPESGFCGVVVANELLDALPVHGFCVQDEGVKERFVTWANDNFQWLLDEPESPQLAQRFNAIASELSAGYVSELNLAAEAWVASVAESLQAGVVLLLDYGFPQQEYYHPERQQGTLMCHYRHRAHDDPFVYPGLQDITSHVNFTALAETAVAAGLDVRGYNTQAFFLLANGITELAEKIAETGERERLHMAQQIQTLTMPNEMGELFKVMALSRDYNGGLRGFELQDLRSRL